MGSCFEVISCILQLILFILILALLLKLFFDSNIYSGLLEYITTTTKENIKHDNELNNAKLEAFKNINRVIEESFTSYNDNYSSETLQKENGLVPDVLNKSNRIQLELYYKPSCPHCKTFMPIWSNICNDLPMNVSYVEINCELDENKEKINENKITSVPSLILLVDNKKKFYMGSRTYDDIARFLNLNGVHLVKRTFEKFNDVVFNDSSTMNDDTTNNIKFSSHCPAVSFDKQIDIANDNYLYQVFNSNGQYGYASGGYNTDKLLTPFQAAYSTIDSYLSSLPDETNPSKSTYKHINECANAYANNIINFGLCDLEQLNTIQGFHSNVSSGLKKSYIPGTDYRGNTEVINAIMNVCGFNEP